MAYTKGGGAQLVRCGTARLSLQPRLPHGLPCVICSQGGGGGRARKPLQVCAEWPLLPVYVCRWILLCAGSAIARSNQLLRTACHAGALRCRGTQCGPGVPPLRVTAPPARRRCTEWCCPKNAPQALPSPGGKKVAETAGAQTGPGAAGPRSGGGGGGAIEAESVCRLVLPGVQGGGLSSHWVGSEQGGLKSNGERWGARSGCHRDNVPISELLHPPAWAWALGPGGLPPRGHICRVSTGGGGAICRGATGAPYKCRFQVRPDMSNWQTQFSCVQEYHRRNTVKWAPNDDHLHICVGLAALPQFTQCRWSRLFSRWSCIPPSVLEVVQTPHGPSVSSLPCRRRCTPHSLASWGNSQTRKRGGKIRGNWSRGCPRCPS